MRGKVCVYSGDSIVACTEKSCLCSIEEDIAEENDFSISSSDYLDNF